jgi:hypothetical protein
MLEQVNSRIPKEEFRNIDNTPKHLLHMTDEDFKPKSPAVIREELQELIKEAKSKIKPVLMHPSDKDKYIKTHEDYEKMHDGWKLVNIDPKGYAILDAHDISLEILRKI